MIIGYDEAMKIAQYKTAAACALTVSLMFALSGCDSTSEVAVQPDGSVSGTLEISGDSAVLGAAGIDCAKVDSLISGQLASTLQGDEAQYSVDDVSSGNTIACVVNFDSGSSIAGSSLLSESDSSYTVVIPRGILNEKNIRTIRMADPGFALSIATPGDIISAPGAAIQGNTATFTDLDILTEGATVEGAKAAPAAQAGSEVAQETTVTPAAVPEKETRPNYLAWALGAIGLAFVLVLGGGIVCQRRRLARRAEEAREESSEETSEEESQA